ncbi:MAG: insulinase family protein [Bacteroidales bacterium]
MTKKFLFLMAFLSISVMYCFGQVNPQAPLELDKNVRYGKLDNGLTYYIMHNEKPAKRADFYIVTNVGAIQETPAQDGLAHFLEHMCLNGSKNFPGKGIISYMESIGCKFGENINAGTGVEQTSYMLNNVPVIREGIIDSSLLVLNDYAAYVTNDPKEIDEERGVILEEKRTRDTYQWRMSVAVKKAIFKGSKYADCSIIGTEENLSTFKPQELQNFYKTWYRPDMQAIIVVGDIDVNAVEGKIKTLFSTLPKAQNPKPKDVITIPDNKEPIISIFTDKELNATQVTLYMKNQPMPKEYRALGVSFLNTLMQKLISGMLNERLDDISKIENAPFLGAGTQFGAICNTMDVFLAGVQAKDGEGVTAFKALLVELEKAKKFGFTQDEYDRAKTNVLRSFESAKENAASRQNGQLVQPLVSHFTSSWPYTTPEYDYTTAKAYLDMVPLVAINQSLPQLFRDDNMVVTFNAPQKEGLVTPVEKDFVDAIAYAKSAEIKAPVATVSNEPLLDATALKGSAVKKTAPGKFGTTVWTLANGIEVIVKPTEYKKDQVIIKTVSNGGKSILPVELLPSIEKNIFQIYLQNAGISKFSSTQLNKMLTGKVASAVPYLSQLEQGVLANGSPKDLETIMQLIYLNYTAPRCDAKEFEVGFNQIKAVLPNMMKQPDFFYSVQLQRAMANGNARMPILDNELISKISIDNIKKALGISFADAVGTKVYITGNVNLDVLKPLVEKYIGSLPVKAKKAAMWIDQNLDLPKGIVDKTFDFEMQTAKTTVGLVYSGLIAKNIENDILMAAATNVLDQTYTKTIREDEGGTYGVSVQGVISGLPKEDFYLLLHFDTEFAKSKKLIEMAKQGLVDISTKGPNVEYVTKARENLIKAFPEKQIQNGYWAGIVYEYYSHNKDNYTNYIETVNKIVTPENIQKFIKQMIDQNNRLDVIMNPKAK